MDEKKYTFIILEKNRKDELDENVLSLGKITENTLMCGDINVFFSE
jgi:hypothetical protein